MSGNNAYPSVLSRAWHRIARCGVVLAVCIPYRVRAYGMKNIPATGSVIVVCNHQSFLDPIFSQSWVVRSFFFAARQSLYDNFFFGMLLRSLYTIPVKRGQGDIAAIKAMIEKLRDGLPVCLYPEATRTYDGRIAPVRPGFALLSRKADAPVVPAVIDGAFECWPRDKKLPSLGRVAVIYGEPISPQQIRQLGDEGAARFVTQTMRQLQHQLRQRLNKKPFDYDDTPDTMKILI